MTAYSLGWQQKEHCAWNQNTGVGAQLCPRPLRLGFVDCFSVLLSQTFFWGWGGESIEIIYIEHFCNGK